jgi:asparagine synthase (glutamine-hydrolysing)
MMALDALHYLPGDILAKVDRASMAVSLEARVPLLDTAVVELAWRMPHAWKVHAGTGKWVLREVLARYVPRALFERPKMGFGIPIDAWLRGPLRDWAEDLLAESRLREAGYFDARAVRQVWQAHLGGGQNLQYQLWGVLCFEAWRARWGG